jgi:type IX secretion system substrate protein
MKKILLTGISFFSLINFLYTQIILDGNIREATWSVPLGTSAGGPVPGFGSGHEINSLYAASGTAGELYLAVGGNVQEGNHILLFIDSRGGGYTTGDFGRTGSAGIATFNKGISFDDSFLPDYCLTIGTNITHDNFFFNLYTLSGTFNNGGGPNNFLGDRSSQQIGADPANAVINRGFELRLTTSVNGSGTDIQYTGRYIKLMAMYISDNGVLSNQFIKIANNGEGNYGSGPLSFNSRSPDPVRFDGNHILPLQFLQVNSRIIEDHSFILWSIADDTEIDYYEVEESNTGSVFHNLKSISSQQNNFKTDYVVEDNSLNIGNNYYRVKAVATNGDIIYSKILKMPYGKIDNTLFVYPNPVKQTLKVQLHSLLKGYYKLHIYNNAGQEIYNRAINHDGLDKTITVQLPSHLQKGIYRLMFINKYEFYKQNFAVE